MSSHRYKDLKIWHKSIELTKLIYDQTNIFPASELYGLTSQIRRSSVSVASNIAEGSGRSTSKEFIYFLKVSLGSLNELDTQLYISKELHFLTEKAYLESYTIIHELQKMITRLMNTLKHQQNQVLQEPEEIYYMSSQNLVSDNLKI